MENKEMNIFQKMSKATEAINRVAKNLQVGVGAAQYKAVGEADVLAAVKPIENEIGIYSYPVSRKIIKDEIINTVQSKEYKGEITTVEKKSVFLRLETVYRFVNIDKPDDYIDITTFGDGFDAQDKAPGKAMTYSDKYALLKAYKIETGDDPDQYISVEETKVTKNQNKKQEVKDEKQNSEDDKPSENLDVKLIDKCKELKMDLKKVAIYHKTTISKLTNEQVQQCIESQEKAIEKQKSKEVKEEQNNG